MDNCPHTNLILLDFGEQRQKLRCRHCHLTIDEQELADGYCPECYEATGYKRSEFDEVNHDPATSDITRYRCEDCGTFIDAENPGD